MSVRLSSVVGMVSTPETPGRREPLATGFDFFALATGFGLVFALATGFDLILSLRACDFALTVAHCQGTMMA